MPPAQVTFDDFELGIVAHSDGDVGYSAGHQEEYDI